jgi:hypothetical protein
MCPLMCLCHVRFKNTRRILTQKNIFAHAHNRLCHDGTHRRQIQGSEPSSIVPPREDTTSSSCPLVLPTVEVIDLTEEAEYEYMCKYPRWFVLRCNHLRRLWCYACNRLNYVVVPVTYFFNKYACHDSVVFTLVWRWWFYLLVFHVHFIFPIFFLWRLKHGNFAARFLSNVCCIIYKIKTNPTYRMVSLSCIRIFTMQSSMIAQICEVAW